MNPQTPTGLKSLVALVVDVIGTLIFIIFALTLITIIWGVVNGWVLHGGESDGVEKGKRILFVGIIVLVIMSSVWGILRLIQASIFG